MSVSERQPELVFSSQNVLEASGRGAVRAIRRWTPAAIGEFAFAAGYDGIEGMPVFDMFPGHTPRAIARAVRSGQLRLSSLHSTWRTTPASRKANQIPGEIGRRTGVLDGVNTPLIGRLVMAEVAHSAAVMGKIMDRVAPHGRLDAVFYPHKDASRDQAQIECARPRHALIQPHERELLKVGAKTLPDFDHAMLEVRGYSGYVLDTDYIRRLQIDHRELVPRIMRNIDRSVPHLAPNVREIHLSADAHDQGSGQLDLSSKLLQWMLDVCKESGQVERIVVEAPGLSQSQYQEIGEGIRDYWQVA